MQLLEVLCDNISKAYGDKVLFSGIHAVIKPGECLVVTGRNGAGKSTLLKIIAGLIRPNTGSVSLRLNGIQVPRNEHSSCLGMVSSELMVYNAMTGGENIKFFMQSRGLNAKSDDIAILGDTVGLGSYMYQPVGGYSSGMKHRLKFAILLAVGAPLWLLDEPSANLDRMGKTFVVKMIAVALASKRTIILATNEEWEAGYGTKKIHLA